MLILLFPVNCGTTPLFKQPRSSVKRSSYLVLFPLKNIRPAIYANVSVNIYMIVSSRSNYGKSKIISFYRALKSNVIINEDIPCILLDWPCLKLSCLWLWLIYVWIIFSLEIFSFCFALTCFWIRALLLRQYFAVFLRSYFNRTET